MIDIHEYVRLEEKVKQLQKDNKDLKERIEKLEARILKRGPFKL